MKTQKSILYQSFRVADKTFKPKTSNQQLQQYIERLHERDFEPMTTVTKIKKKSPRRQK